MTSTTQQTGRRTPLSREQLLPIAPGKARTLRRRRIRDPPLRFADLTQSRGARTTRIVRRRPHRRGTHLALPESMAAAVLIGLFFLSFLFDTRLGLVFLAAAIVLLYRGAPHKRMTIVHPHDEAAPPAWKDPWGTGTNS